MSRVAIEQYLYLLDQAFHGHGEHDLLSNIRSLNAADWHTVPSGGERTIFQIARHVGECKFVYENHAFGDASMNWDRAGSIPTVDEDAEPGTIVKWLRGVVTRHWSRASVL